MIRFLGTGAAALALSSTLTLTAPATARAQDVGVTAGFSSADVSFSPPGSVGPMPDRRTGFVAGLSLLAPTGRLGGYQIEVLIHRSSAGDLAHADDAIRLTYLEVPVLLHLDVVRRGRSAAYLLAGPAVAFTLSASYDDGTATAGIHDDIKPFDFGISAGAGVESGRLMFTARYSWSWMGPFRDGDSRGTFMNHAWTVTTGVRFGR